jgi:hypothetical protein
MKKRFAKPSVLNTINVRRLDTWHNGADVEIYLYVRSLQKAAQLLVASLDPEQTAVTGWDIGPVLLLYRQSVELHLKSLVGAGSTFLPTPTDPIPPYPITLYKTHSLRWLAQIVSQIIKAVRWEDEFKCEGTSSLAEFAALVEELEATDPVSCAVHSKERGLPGELPPSLRREKVLLLLPKLEALIHLLAATADGLAATSFLMEQDPSNAKVAAAIH